MDGACQTTNVKSHRNALKIINLFLLISLMASGARMEAAAANDYLDYTAGGLGNVYQFDVATGGNTGNFILNGVPTNANGVAIAYGIGGLYHIAAGSRIVYKLRPNSSQVQGSFSLPSGVPISSTGVGIAYNNDRFIVPLLYFMPAGVNTIYKIDLTSNTLQGSFAPSGLPLNSAGVTLTYGNGIIYYAAPGLANIYKISASTGEILGNFLLANVPVSSSGCALAFGNNKLFYQAGGSAQCYQLDPNNGAVLGSFSEIGAPIGAKPALAFIAKPTIWMSPGRMTPIEGDSGTCSFNRTGDAIDPIIINYTIGGNATNGSDYNFFSYILSQPAGTFTIPAGSSGREFGFISVLDNKIEGDEQVVISTATSANNSYAISDPQSETFTIIDYPVASVVATDPNASETGPDKGTFTLSRSGPTTAAMKVYFTLSGTANNGSDYTISNAQSDSSGMFATIPIGSASTPIDIVPIDDLLVEGSESVVMQLSTSPTSLYQVGPTATATITIADNDAPIVTIAATDAFAAEPGSFIATDPGTFTITRSGDLTSQITVGFGRVSTATDGTDFTSIPSSVVLAPGQASTAITITPLADALPTEGTESIVLTLNSGSGYSVGSPNSATVTIADALKINFALAGAPIPSGYLVDDGSIYGARNGLSYGWNINHTDVTRDRNINSDQRLDTLCHFHSGGIWEIALANGNYNVTVSVGDAASASSHTINVEGVNYWTNLSLAANVFSNATRKISVTDGKLTVDQGTAPDKATRINYIEIIQTP